jgi:lipoprotein-anchoring transpeptidase ErfK/SrfK
MRPRIIVPIILVVVAVLAGSGAVYAYDRGKRDEIAAGISVNGVPVGGLTEDEARAKLRATLLDPLNRPVTVEHDGQRFTLTPRQARVGVDIDGSVAEAIDRSRDGNVVSRAWRELRGGKVRADVEAKVSYSRPAIAALVARVQGSIDAPAKDATLDLDKGIVDPQPSHDGVEVKAARLRRDIERALLSSAPGDRGVRVRTAVVRPAVSTEQLAKQYPAVVIVDRRDFRLTLYKNLRRAKTYGIAVGKVGLETPAGLYHVQNKAIDPAWHVPDSDWAGKLAGKVIAGDDPSNPIKARWMGIFDGAGIHGTSDDASIGSAASHGCIRMHIPDVEELYDQVPVGAPVYIS